MRNYARGHALLASVVADIYDLLWEPEQPVLDEQVVEDDDPLLWDDDGSAGRSATLTGGSNYVTDPSMP